LNTIDTAIGVSSLAISCPTWGSLTREGTVTEAPTPSSLIYGWNERGSPPEAFTAELVDETLRDGCQSATVKEPGIDDKLALLHLMVWGSNIGSWV
jgi:hypothetical protein